MKKETLVGMVGKHVELSENFKIRDEKSVKRITSALIKLLFPNKSFNKDDLKLMVDIVLEFRQRIRDWLHKIAPGEFPKEKLSIKILS